MVKNIGLDIFVIGPDLVAAEYIDFHGKTLGGRRQMSDQESHILINLGMVGQVAFDIGTKDADIGLTPAVRHRAAIKIMLLVIEVNLFLFFLKILFEQAKFV